MKKVLVLLLVGIVGVIVFVPDIRKELLNLGKDTAEDWKIVDEESSAIPEHEKVYTSRKDQQYYHREDCPKLEELGSAVPTSLQKAKSMYMPCPICNPQR